jgi:DNA repair exonuclease SbcCD ATPase subunit
VEELRSEIQGYRVEISELEVKKGELESELRDVRSDIELHGQIQEDLEHNERIKREIDETEKSLEDVRSDLREADEKAQDAYSRIKVAERDTKRLSDDLTRYRDLSDDMRAYDLFIEATNRDGVPYELIQKTMPRIEEEVNDILSQIVPFGLIMHLDGKSIDAHIIYDEENHWPVELASGMEKFVSSLAIRVALINISSLPRPDFLAVDEGFGVLDRSNLNSLSLLFDYLKTQFKFCVIISHLDVMRDMVNDLIEIQPQADGRSGVRYI